MRHPGDIDVACQNAFAGKRAPTWVADWLRDVSVSVSEVKSGCGRFRREPQTCGSELAHEGGISVTLMSTVRMPSRASALLDGSRRGLETCQFQCRRWDRPCGRIRREPPTCGSEPAHEGGISVTLMAPVRMPSRASSLLHGFRTGRGRSRLFATKDRSDQNAGTTAPLYLVSMNCLVSGLCNAATSFWMAGESLLSSRVTRMFA